MCPWPRCTEAVPHTQLFCKAHWFQIPKPERVELNAAFKARAKDARRHRKAVDACVLAARSLGAKVVRAERGLHADDPDGEPCIDEDCIQDHFTIEDFKNADRTEG